MDKVLEPHKLPQLYHEKIENVNKSITTKKIESVIKKKTSQTNKTSGPDNFTDQFHQTFKEVNVNFSQTPPKKKDKKAHFQIHFIRPALPDKDTRKLQTNIPD